MINLFLSASVPIPGRHPEYFATSDTIAIRDAIKALVYTVLTQTVIVFGGHPAITPLVALMIRGMPHEARRRIILFQSAAFEDHFVDENDEFIDLRLVPAIPGDREASVRHMRQTMIASQGFDAAIFIGGMQGILAEYEMFHKSHQHAPCYPIASTGGAALELFKRIGDNRNDLINELTYPTLFRQLLTEISDRKRS